MTTLGENERFDATLPIFCSATLLCERGAAPPAGPGRIGHFDPQLRDTERGVVVQFAPAAGPAAMAHVRGVIDLEDDLRQRIAGDFDVPVGRQIPPGVQVDRGVRFQAEPLPLVVPPDNVRGTGRNDRRASGVSDRPDQLHQPGRRHLVLQGGALAQDLRRLRDRIPALDAAPFVLLVVVVRHRHRHGLAAIVRAAPSAQETAGLIVIRQEVRCCRRACRSIHGAKLSRRTCKVVPRAPTTCLSRLVAVPPPLWNSPSLG